MQEKELYLLLNVIKKNGDIKRLVREGISYIQIAELTNEAILNKFVTYNYNKIELSESGEAKFEEIKSNYKRINKVEWIECYQKANMLVFRQLRMYDSEVKNRLNLSVQFIFKDVFSVLHSVTVTG